MHANIRFLISENLQRKSQNLFTQILTYLESVLITKSNANPNSHQKYQ
ncbi:hypothetical protein JCM19297_1226 [Nonlabens ulvanivorans]|nr:hypothetical protein JCM19297_1226 [Nonlabens ulvanivorans]